MYRTSIFLALASLFACFSVKDLERLNSNPVNYLDVVTMSFRYCREALCLTTIVYCTVGGLRSNVKHNNNSTLCSLVYKIAYPAISISTSTSLTTYVCSM